MRPAIYESIGQQKKIKITKKANNKYDQNSMCLSKKHLQQKTELDKTFTRQINLYFNRKKLRPVNDETA